MGRIAIVEEVETGTSGSANVRTVKCDRGGGDNRLPEHFAGIGDDSVPLASDYAHLAPQAGTGRDSVVGYVDPKNLHKSQDGDKRIYARDANGDLIVELWLKNDGTAITENENATSTVTPEGAISGVNALGSFVLGTDGIFTVNGVTILPDGTITTPKQVVTPSLLVAGKELGGHDHPAGEPPGNTGENN